MPIQFTLEHVIEKTLAATYRAPEQRALKELIGVRLPAKEARHTWQRIQDHKWYISERLGRDVGLHVAAVDFIENIEPLRVTKRPRRDTLPPTLPMMKSLTRSFQGN